MRHVLLIDCNDEKGLVSKIATALFHRDANIISNREFVDPSTNRFFMRTEFEGAMDEETMFRILDGLLPKDANVRIESKRKKRLVILATKEPHCLGDILIRCAYNNLNATIEAVISNRSDLKSLVEKFEVPFFHVAHDDKDPGLLANEMLSLIDPYNPDWLVSAKYMRILPPMFVQRFQNRIINIHHSFLPAFVGASPYRQAYDRGVKIIGATAHFINDDLDQGPIICQDVIPVTHRHGAKDMAAAGCDVEKTVLSRALQLAVNESIFVNGNKTVVFE
jgi:formyltetrahydrofolate deformylase